MIKCLLAISIIFQITLAMAQMPPSKSINCKGQRTTLVVDFQNCHPQTLACKSRVTLPRVNPFEIGLQVFLKQVPQSPMANLIITSDDRSKVQVGFSGAYTTKGSFVGETHIKIQNIELTEPMACVMR